MVKRSNLFLFLILGMFMISIVSAFDFDNVKSYNPTTKEVTITNALGLGANIGRAKLLTPLNVKVGAGYQKVAEFEIESYQDYNSAIRDFSFLDLKTDKSINRDIDIKYKTYETITIDDYKTECSFASKTNNETCSQIKTGSHEEQRETWKDLGLGNLKDKEKLTIGLFTDVQIGDHVDWVPTIYGVKVPEWAGWTEDLNTDLVSYYKLDESSGAVIDSYGSNNGTNYGATPNVAGKINTAYDFDGSNDYVSLGNGFDGYSAISFGGWTYIDTIENNAFIFNKQHLAGNVAPHWGIVWATYMGVSNYFCTVSTVNGRVSFDTLASVETGKWVHLMTTYDGTTIRFYKNGVETESKAQTGNILTNAGDTLLFARTINNVYSDGKADEVGIWSRALTSTEVTQLYNSGDGLGFNSRSPPEITLNSPSSTNYTTSPQSLTFNFTASDDINLDNVTFYVNDVLNQTNASGINNTDYLFDLELSDGDYTIYGTATDNESQETNSSSIRIFIDSIKPTITATLNASIIYTVGDKIQLNTTITDTNLDTCWYNYNGTNTTITDCKTATLNQTNITTATGQTIITVYANDTIGHENSTIVNFTYDTIPPTINITSPSGLLDYFRMGDNETLNYNITDTNLDSCWYSYPITEDCYQESANIPNQTGIDGNCGLNYTGSYSLTDNWNDGDWNTGIFITTTRYFTYIKPADATDAILTFKMGTSTNNVSIPTSCFDYDNISIRYTYFSALVLSTLSCKNNSDWVSLSSDSATSAFYEEAIIWNSEIPLNCSANSTNFTYVKGLNNLTVYSNDTIGNENSESTSWDYKVIENSFTYNNETRAGDQENFSLNLTLNPSVELSSASFSYNNIQYPASISSSGQNRVIYIEDFQIPIFSNDTNVTLFFVLELDDSTEINTTGVTQLARVIFLDNCSTYTNKVFNISLYDEGLKTPLSGDIEFNYELLNVPDYNVVNSLNMSFTDKSNIAICSGINLTNKNFVQSIEIRYGSDGYASELYHIQRAPISDDTVALKLFDLNNNDSTEFKVIYQDSTFNFIEGAVIQLQRKYISEGIYETVEAPITSNGGVSIVHIDLDAVKYRATVVKDGVVLDEFDNLVFECQSAVLGECEQKLLGTIDPRNDIDLDTTRDFSYSINRSQNTITLSFTIPSGTPSSANIQLIHRDQFGSSQMCNKTILSSAGSVQCTFNDTIGDSYIDLRIYKDGVPIAIQSYIISGSTTGDFLGNNFIIIVVLLLSVVGMALTSPEWIIINGIIVMVIAGALWLVNGVNFVVGLGNLMWLIIAAGILIFKLAKQEDK